MNGIDYNALMGNTGFFGGNAKIDKEEINPFASLGKKEEKKEAAKAQQDTVDISRKSREIPRAGYERPGRVRNPISQTSYKAVDEAGIQEGVTLSDNAKKLLEELKEKYANMDFYIASCDSAQEQNYYLRKGTKEYSVLIDPGTLEDMAADKEIRGKYEAILDGTEENFDTLKEGLGEDFDKIRTFGITIDKEGKVSYVVQLVNDSLKNSQKAEKENTAEKLEERIKERKEKQKEQLESVKADSLEELIKAIQKKLHPQEEAV